MTKDYVVNYVENIKEAVKYARLMGYVLQEQMGVSHNDDLEVVFKDYKSWGFNFDGYDVNIYFNSVQTSIYDSEDILSIETLQIWGENMYFIPFSVAFKIAVAFFGKKNFVLTQIITPTKLIYCWNKMFDYEGKTMKPDEKLCTPKQFMEVKYYLSKQIPSFL